MPISCPIVARAIFVAWWVLASSITALAQPMVTQPDGRVIIKVPNEILIDKDGKTKVITKDMGPMLMSQVEEMRPQTVPVISITRDGFRVDGLTFKNCSGEPVYSFARSRPGRVIFTPGLGYEIETMYITSSSHGPLIQPGQELLLDGWNPVQVLYRGGFAYDNIARRVQEIIDEISGVLAICP